MDSNNTPPLYALLPITDTEGLPDGQYRCLNKYGKESDVKYSFDDGKWFARVAIELYQFTHYLRPLPEGTVAVSEERLRQLEELADRVTNCHHYLMGVPADKITVEDTFVALGYNRNGFYLTKAAQMGE